MLLVAITQLAEVITSRMFAASLNGDKSSSPAGLWPSYTLATRSDRATALGWCLPCTPLEGNRRAEVR